MELDKFKQGFSELTTDKTDLIKIFFEDIDENTPHVNNVEPDADDRDLTLDTVIYVSQKLKTGEIKKFEFVVCEVWLKRGIWTIVNVNKPREEQNFWILFQENGTYYLKKGIRGPIGVHVYLKHKK